MSNIGGFDSIRSQLRDYKRKYHLNALMRGSLLFFGFFLAVFLLVTSLEYFGRFSNIIRAVLLFVFIAVMLGSLFQWILKPLLKILNIKTAISDEQAARQIGQAFPEISDKLLNALQLGQIHGTQSDLISASISQRTEELKWYRFPKAVRFSENRRFLKYLLGPAIAVTIIALLVPELFSESTERIINYQKTYVPTAPYQITILNEELKTFRNEDFELKIKFEGQLIPENAFILNGERRMRMKQESRDVYSFVWRKVQDDENFQVSAAGYNSQAYLLDVMARPELSSFQVQVDYPSYTGLEDESLNNIGNFSVPEGSVVKWLLQTKDAKFVDLQINKESVDQDKKVIKGGWTHKKIVKNSFDYSLSLVSNEGISRDMLKYSVKSIPDARPAISAKQAFDSALFNYVVVGGEIKDDYGFSNLRLVYKMFSNDEIVIEEGKKALNFSTSLKSQNFLHNWDISSLNLSVGQRLEYYIEVADNDGVNGPKFSRSTTFNVKVPSDEEMRKSINENSRNIENQMNDLQNEARELNEELKDIMDETKSKKNLEWKDKNKIDQVLKKHEELKKQLEKLNKEMEKDLETKERFDEQSEKIQKKSESLKKLMNEILDEETKELLKELQRLLEEKSPNEQIQNELENLENKSFNLEKELDRAIEMFKQLQFEERMENVVEKLNELSEKQEELSQKTEDKSQDNKELQKEQEKINKEFEELSKEMDDLKELDESMENPNGMDESREERQEIQESMKESTDQLQKNKNSKASESQKKSSQKMDELAEKMNDMMMQMQSQSLMEDMNNLRQILENLITLSFEQEELMKEFKKVNQSDPRYVELGQEQLKLKDDARIIEDSLLALAKRVFQIQSFVTREVNEMNENMEDALEAIKDRKNGLAAGKQQFAMTSINNLALMLNDVLKQMQEQMASQMAGEQMCSKPKQGSKPSMSQLQQSLNQKVRELKQSGKQGRELSEELAKLAREQEELRKMLQGLGEGEGQLDQDGQQKLKDLEKIMEESEKDLVHKRLTQELLERQEQILTRLLESEKAQREQKMDPNREAQTADKQEPNTPPDLEKYFEEKKNQTELLKTISPFLNSYYRERVNDYFENIYD